MKTNFLIITILLLASISTQAQSVQNVISELSTPSNGVVKVEMDRISTSALEFRRATSTVPGYRICLYSGTDQNARSRANEAISRLKSISPNLQAKWLYDAPVFKVHCGAWLTRIEATLMLAKLKASFGSAFILSDKIALTELLTIDKNISLEGGENLENQAAS